MKNIILVVLSMVLIQSCRDAEDDWKGNNPNINSSFQLNNLELSANHGGTFSQMHPVNGQTQSINSIRNSVPVGEVAHELRIIIEYGENTPKDFIGQYIPEYSGPNLPKATLFLETSIFQQEIKTYKTKTLTLQLKSIVDSRVSATFSGEVVDETNPNKTYLITNGVINNALITYD